LRYLGDQNISLKGCGLGLPWEDEVLECSEPFTHIPTGAFVSALIFYTHREQIIVAMDTLAMRLDDAIVPGFYTSKAFLIPHLRGLMCGMGILEFSTDWFVRMQRILARDMLHLNEYTPDALREVAEPYKFTDKHTSTIYHFGYAEAEESHFGFAYRSANNFESERLPIGGWGIKPPIPEDEINLKEFPDDLIKTMFKQRAQEDTRPAGERLYIGGEIQLYSLERDLYTVSTIYTFDDYADCYDEMCWHLPANAQWKELREGLTEETTME
jgi:hypothetical protein